MSGEFGHTGISGIGMCIDTWGAGPFEIIDRKGKSWTFEDSDRFGPFIIGKNGDPLDRQPGERSPFWPAHTAWRQQGRRLAEDGKSCIYTTLKPTTAIRIAGRHVMVIEHGDEGGEIIILNEKK